MLNSHSFKIVMGFCGMILLGLITLVVLDSLKEQKPVVKSQNTLQPSTLPPVNIETKTPIKSTSIPAKKTTR